ncbi:GNAT family N-acetyltransferase [Paenibacillus lutrae]|nr:GNAT family N-acetyltransferase [Paenibacillus lutrae]
MEPITAYLNGIGETDSVQPQTEPEPSPDGMVEAYTLPLIQDGVAAYMANVRTQVQLVQVGPHLIPMTYNDKEYLNSYVCSPYSTYVSYAYEELVLFRSRALRAVLAGVIGTIAPLLKAGRINRNIHLNNWLLSTNLYEEMDREDLRLATGRLVTEYPGHAIVFRSLNERTNSGLMEILKSLGYRFVPSRQVYFFDGRNPQYLEKQNNRWDATLLKKSGYTVLEHEDLTESDYKRIVDLYEQLYIQKYSALNPQFTEAYISNCHRNGLMYMQGLKDADGVLQGVVGCFIRGDVMTVPLVGYDTSLPQKLGLYRMLMSLVLNRAAQQRQLLHLSSGAAHFKRLRGGEPFIEYSAVYIRHLPAGRRMMWSVLGGILNRIGVPVMRKYQL